MAFDYIEKFRYFESASGAASIVINSILLVLILRCSQKKMGQYKHLLTAYAANDIFYSCMHCAIQTKFILKETTLGCLPMGIIRHSRVASAAFGSSFGQSCMLLASHFMFRWIAVKRATWLNIMRTWWFLSYYAVVYFTCSGLLGCSLFFGLVVTSSGLDELRTIAIEKYAVPAHEVDARGWLIGQYRDPEGHMNWRPATGIAGLFVLTAPCFVVSIVTGVSIFVFLHGNNVMSRKARSLQMQLFIALCVQAVIPLITMFVPSFIGIVFPLFGISIEIIGDVLSPMISLYPSLDGLCIMFLIKDYRRGLTSAIVNVWRALCCIPHPHAKTGVTISIVSRDTSK